MTERQVVQGFYVCCIKLVNLVDSTIDVINNYLHNNENVYGGFYNNVASKKQMQGR